MKLYTFANGQLTEGIAVTQTTTGLAIELGHEEGKKIFFPVSGTNPPEIADGRIMRASIEIEGLQWHLIKETGDMYAFLHIITFVPRADKKFSPFGRWYVMRGFPLTILKTKTDDSWEGLIRFLHGNRIEIQLSDERYFAINCTDGALVLQDMPA